MRRRTAASRILASLALAAVAALGLVACGGDGDGGDASSSAAPEKASFPAPESDSLDQLIAEIGGTDELVVSPAGMTYEVGANRVGFGVFTAGREQITDAKVALYAKPARGGEVAGPFPARIESLETEPAFTARTTAEDPDAAKVVYAAELNFDRPGEWRLVAVIRHDGEEVAVRMPSIVVERDDPVPDPGEPAPRVHTPTAEDVGGNLAKIDTRVPAGTMHEDDLADVLGKRPVVLLFATPALCQSRVCGPVVDVAEQVKRDVGDEVAFIHMEIWQGNDPNKGVRPQVDAYGLKTEPWLFVIDRRGRIDSRIEGAFSVAELTKAVERVTN